MIGITLAGVALVAATAQGHDRIEFVDTLPLADRTALFVATVVALRDEGRAPALRVDPRPLVPSPALVTLHRFDLPSDPAQTQPWRAPFAELAEDDLDARRKALEQLETPAMDGMLYSECPPSPVPPMDDLKGLWSRCPKVGFRVAFLALPRRGGSWTPNHAKVDRAFEGREVYSVRTIVRKYDAGGGMEVSSDHVFERLDGKWVLLGRWLLSIVE